jgi:hypothetical protein
MYFRAIPTWLSAIALLHLLHTTGAAPTLTPRWEDNPECRFSPDFTQQQVLNDPDNFIWDVLYWEGKFHQNNVGYNTGNGMTYDGTLLDPTTGVATDKHPFSAASKEVRILSLIIIIISITKSIMRIKY